jgi:hypothetical protein
MFAVTGVPSFAGSPLSSSLFFARQPEPDLEFTEEELEQTTNVRSSSPVKPPKKSGGRPLLWMLMLLLVGGAAYVAMEPEIVTDLLGPLVGESPAPQTQPPLAMKPPRPIPAPGTAPGQSEPSPSAPVQPTPVPQGTAPTAVPTPAPAPTPGMPTDPGSTTSRAPSAPAASSVPTNGTPSPLYGEGQKVTALSPGESITLMQDPASTKPGPTVRPGMTLTILDGELQNGGWSYSVRSEDGAKGWISENRLRLKP